MRNSPTSPWICATATQYEFFAPPARLFHMRAHRRGVPIDVLHEYVGDSATFQMRIAGRVRSLTSPVRPSRTTRRSR